MDPVDAREDHLLNRLVGVAGRDLTAGQVVGLVDELADRPFRLSCWSGRVALDPTPRTDAGEDVAMDPRGIALATGASRGTGPAMAVDQTA